MNLLSLVWILLTHYLIFLIGNNCIWYYCWSLMSWFSSMALSFLTLNIMKFGYYQNQAVQFPSLKLKALLNQAYSVLWKASCTENCYCRIYMLYSGWFAIILSDQCLVRYSMTCVRDGLLARNIPKEEVLHDHWKQLGSIHLLHQWYRVPSIRSSVRSLVFAACCCWVSHLSVLGS